MDKWLSVICTAATFLLTLLNIWKGVKHPVKDNHEAIRDLSSRVAVLEKKVENDWSSFEEQESVNALILKSQWAIMSHLLDGNHTKQLTACRDEAETMLFKKGGSL